MSDPQHVFRHELLEIVSEYWALENAFHENLRLWLCEMQPLRPDVPHMEHSIITLKTVGSEIERQICLNTP